jgi:hypothetical protein
MQDGTTVDAEAWFLALDRPEDVAKIDSLELTGAWINEARHMPLRVVNAVKSRCRRYPPMDRGGPKPWTGVIMDTNSPDDGHWWYRYAEHAAWRVDSIAEEKLDRWEFFAQPGGLIYQKDAKTGRPLFTENLAAENIKNLSGGHQYYWGQVPGNDLAWVLAMVCSQYSTVFDGKPVYQGVWRDDFHMSQAPMEVYDGLPILLGFDFGLSPACVMAQLGPHGQLRVLREYLCERGGIRQFAQEVIIPALRTHFPHSTYYGWGDPAGMAATQVDVTLTPIGELNALHIPTEPAPTNDFLARREAVCGFLSGVTDGQPRFILDPRCQSLRRGFNGGYHYARVRLIGVEDRYQERPAKNSYSHEADALQALCLGVQQGGMQQARQARNEAEPVIQAGWGGFTP